LADEQPLFDFLTLLQKTQFNTSLIRTFAERRRGQNLPVAELHRLLGPSGDLSEGSAGGRIGTTQEELALNDDDSGVFKPDVRQRVKEAVLNERIRHLESQVFALGVENADLRDKVSFWENHPTLARGIKGEDIIARISGYNQTPGN